MIRTGALIANLVAFVTGAAVYAQEASRVMAHVPERPDPEMRYVFYLHGRIVEDQGIEAVSPDFGRYEYKRILEHLAEAGFIVISEVRAPSTDPEEYATFVASQISELLASGISYNHVTVIGASKGSVISMLVATRLEVPIRYVVMANCNDYVFDTFDLDLHGQVLSIYEASDPFGQTCGPLFERSSEIDEHQEIRLETGLGHGFIFRPLDEWVEPAIAWVKR